MTKIYEAVMPANIALIKYMGKKNPAENTASNLSFSYALNNLNTTVKLIPAPTDSWDEKTDITLNTEEKLKFIQHLDFLRKKFKLNSYFKIFSENNFPASCGLASSASSFAALTACAVKAFGIKNLRTPEIAQLSRHGSGSSCRSFFSPWALWDGENITGMNIFPQNLIHQVIVVSKAKKNISSRQAHQQVQTSLLFSGREKRAQIRLKELLSSFEQKDWQKSYDIVWQEFWDMHVLFETCQKPFGYLLPDSLEVLAYLRDYWQKNHDGPLVTMDAGPNIHLLFREDQQVIASDIKNILSQKFLVL